MMRVVHILAPAPVGGLERVVQMLAAEQRADGDDVHVVAVVPEGQSHADEFFAPLRRHDIAVHAITLPTRAYRRERQAIVDLCAKYRPHIVHTHGAQVDVVTAGAVRGVGSALVTTMHGFTGGNWRNCGYEWLQRRAGRARDAVVAVARPIASRLLDAGIAPECLHVVRNALQPDGEPLDRDEARRRLALEPTSFVVGWVGRISPEKGLDVLIDALPAVSPSPHGPIHLAALGEGTARAALERRAILVGSGLDVSWHGRVAAAARLFRAFDVLVLSSRTEGTPMTVFEAMAAHVPLIATRVGGVPDMVSDDEALLISPDDPAALAEAIGAVRADPGAARRRAHAAHARLQRDGDVGRWTARYRYVYEAALDVARARARGAR